MKIEDLRALSEIVRQGYSVSRAAVALGRPQPAVSRQLRALERELGVDIFRRNPKRLLGLTQPGAAVLEFVDRLPELASRLKREVARVIVGQDAVIEEYLQSAEEVFGTVAQALERGTVRSLLRGPIAHAGFTRLN